MDRVMFAALTLHLLTFQLFALTLFTLPMGHFFLALALYDFAFP